MLRKILLTLIIGLGLLIPIIHLEETEASLDPLGDHLGSKSATNTEKGFGFIDLTEDKTGEETARSTLRAIFNLGRNILGPLAVLFLIYGSIRLGTSQGDEEAGKAREVIIDSIIAMVLVTAAPLVVDIFYQGGEGEIDTIGEKKIEAPWQDEAENISEAEKSLYFQILAIINFIMLTLIPVMIGVMIYYGALHIFSIGDSEWLTKERQGMYWGLIGLVIVLLAKQVVSVFLGTILSEGKEIKTQKGIINLSPIQAETVGLVNAFLYLSGTVAVVMLIYTGYQILLSDGDSEQIEKGKRQVLYIIIGIVIILSSYIIVNEVITEGAIIK